MKSYKAIKFGTNSTKILDYWIDSFGYTVYKRENNYLLLPNDKSELFEVKDFKEVIDFIIEGIETILEVSPMLYECEKTQIRNEDLKILKDFRKTL